MRRKITIKIPGKRSEESGERDAGKSFLITELPADQAERLCMQVLFLVFQSLRPDGKQNSEPDAGAGAAVALALKGLNFADIRVAHALQDPSVDAQVWQCVRYQHAPNQEPLPIEPGENSVIEEVATRMLLRMEVFKLHLGFSRGGDRPSSEFPQTPPGSPTI